MTKSEIMEILPHRDNMLLVEEVNLEGNISVGKYTIKGDEYFLQGHFPNNPVVPGVILCEMMGQAACLLIDTQGFTPYFTGIKNIKFKQKVVPGDTFISKCELIKKMDVFYIIKAAGYVNDKLCCQGELSFAVIKYV